MEDINDIMEEANSDKLLSEVDVGYIKDCISNQIDDRLNVLSEKNYLKMIELDMPEDIEEEDKENITESVYKDVIEMIADKVGFTVDYDQIKLAGLSKNLYKFFVLNHSDNITYFLEMYIIENLDDIVQELNKTDGVNTSRIEGIDSKHSLILNNIADVIDTMSGESLNFEDFLDYVNRHEDAKSSTEEVKRYVEDSVINDTDNIMDDIFKSLIDEAEGFSKIYTNLMTNLFERWNEGDN